MASEAQIRANRENAKKAGRPRIFADKLHAALVRKAEEQAEALSDVLLEKAKDGDLPAIKEMFDRALGKALQRSELTGRDGKDLPVPLLVNAIPSNDSDQEDSGDAQEDTGGAGGNVSE